MQSAFIHHNKQSVNFVSQKLYPYSEKQGAVFAYNKSQKFSCVTFSKIQRIIIKNQGLQRKFTDANLIIFYLQYLSMFSVVMGIPSQNTNVSSGILLKTSIS